jgi:lipoprotein-anchoring transpeptidase ErfK/SrfK
MNSRSIALLAGATALLGGCSYQGVPDPAVSQKDAQYLALVPKVETSVQFERYRVDDPTGEAPGTIVVDTKDKYL